MSIAVGVFSRVNDGGGRDEPTDPKLPKGAEAALLSIVEVLPDPRNHLAMVRDLSGEVRVTEVDRARLEAVYENRVPDVPASQVHPIDVSEVDVRDDLAAMARPVAMDPYYDLGEIAENAPLTGHLFMPAD